MRMRQNSREIPFGSSLLSEMRSRFLKLDGQQHHLAVGSHSHVRSPHPHAGGHDAGHAVHFLDAVGILPEETDQQISGENLTVVGMPGKIQIGSGFGKGGKLIRFVVQNQDGFFFVQGSQKFLRREPAALNFFRAPQILSAHQVEGVVDQDRFVVQKADVGILEKLKHPGIVRIRSLPHREAAKERFVHVMVSETGEASVGALDLGEETAYSIRILDGFKFVVEGVSRKQYQIRVQFIDPIHQMFHMIGPDAVAEMQVGSQNDPKRTLRVQRFVHGHLIFLGIEGTLMEVSVGPGEENRTEDEDPSPLEGEKGAMMASSQDQGDQIRRQYKENGVEEIAQKQIADRLQDPMQPQGTLEQKRSQNRGGKKQIQYEKDSAEASLPQSWVQGFQPL